MKQVYLETLNPKVLFDDVRAKHLNMFFNLKIIFQKRSLHYDWGNLQMIRPAFVKKLIQIYRTRFSQKNSKEVQKHHNVLSQH